MKQILIDKLEIRLLDLNDMISAETDTTERFGIMMARSEVFNMLKIVMDTREEI